MTAQRFWGAAARARGPLLTFTARAADRTKSLGTQKATGEDDTIRIVGGLSAGSVGWVLTGELRRHRWTLTLYVAARQEGRQGPAGIQDFDYEALITGLTPGRYRVRVIHLYLDRQSEAVGAPLVVLEQTLSIGRSESRSISAMLFWLGSLCCTFLGA